MLFIELITYCSCRTNDIYTAWRVRVTANRYWVILDRQVHIATINSDHGFCLELLLNVLLHIFKFPWSIFLSVDVFMTIHKIYTSLSGQ